ANQRYESIRTTGAHAEFYSSEDAQRNANARLKVVPEFLFALPGRGFRRTRSDPLQSLRALSRPRASSKSRQDRHHPPIALISPPPGRSAHPRVQDSRRLKALPKIVRQAGGLPNPNEIYEVAAAPCNLRRRNSIAQRPAMTRMSL